MLFVYCEKCNMKYTGKCKKNTPVYEIAMIHKQE